MAAREAGLLGQLSPLSLLMANALNAQVRLRGITGFRHGAFAELINGVGAFDLSSGDPVPDALLQACTFVGPGMKAATITKLGALFRPHAIPILDQHVSNAFGFGPDGFTTEVRGGWSAYVLRIRQVLDRLQRILIEQREILDAIRTHPWVRDIPHIDELSLLHLLDIVIWTTRDDQIEDIKRRSPKVRDYWISEGGERHRMYKSDFRPVPVH